MATRKSSRQSYRSPEFIFGMIGAGVVLLIGLALYFWLGWNLYPSWLVAINIATFLLYRIDKRRAAREGATRIPEIVLHVLALAGGVIGGWLGMFVRPRHKVQKPIFWVVLIACTLLHAFLFYWIVFAR